MAANSDQFLMEMSSGELADELHRSQNLEEISFETEPYDIYAETTPYVEEPVDTAAVKIPAFKLLVEEDEDIEC